MQMSNLKRIAATLISASLGAAALHAQDNTPPAEPDKKEAEKPVYSWPTLDIGWGGYGLSGLSRTFLHYATPPNGLFIDDFRFLGTDPAERNYGFVGFRGVPEQDSVLESLFAYGFGRTVFTGSMTRSNFYDNTPIVIDGSQRKVQEADFRQTVGSMRLGMVYRTDQQDDVYEPPKQDLHQRTRLWDVSGDGTLNGSQLGLGFSSVRFFDATGVYPVSDTDRWNAHFARQLTGNFALDGMFVHSQINQAGLAGCAVDSINVAGDWDLGPTTLLLFKYHEDWLDLPAVQNAYDRKRIGSSVQLMQRVDGWSTQVSYQHKESERLRMDQTYVDVPMWDTFQAKASRKLSDGVHLNLRGSYEHMSGQAVMETTDPLPLYWNNRAKAQVKVDQAADKFSSYGSVSFVDLQNNARNFELDTTSYVLGATYEVSPFVEVFGEYSLDQNQVGGAPADTPAYRSFFPSGRVITTGLSWAVRPSTWVSASFTDFTTDNDNPLFLPDGNVTGRFFTINLKHRTASGNEYGLVFAPWSFDDSVTSQMNYTTCLLMLTAAVKF